MNLTIGQLLGLGWQSFKKYWPIWLVASLVFSLTALPAQLLNYQSVVTSGQEVPPFSLLEFSYFLAGMIATLFIAPGITQLQLETVEGQPLRLATVFALWPLFGKFLISSILYGLMVMLGFIALFIPGVYLAVRYGLTPYALVRHRELSVFEAMSQVGALMKGKIINVLGLLVPIIILAAAISVVAGMVMAWLFEGVTVMTIVTENLLGTIPSALATTLVGVAAAAIYLELDGGSSTVTSAEPAVPVSPSTPPADPAL